MCINDSQKQEHSGTDIILEEENRMIWQTHIRIYHPIKIAQEIYEESSNSLLDSKTENGSIYGEKKNPCFPA